MQGGIGWDKLPLIANYDTTIAYTRSYTKSTSHPLLQIGLLAKLFNNNPVNVELTPFVSYGIDVVNSENGNHITYGIGANIIAALGNNIPFKLVATGNFIGRNGTWTRTVENADYNYTLIRYGGSLRFMGKNNTFWIQPGVYFDNPSDRITGASPSLVANIEAELNNKWRISVSYSANYLNQGSITLPTKL